MQGIRSYSTLVLAAVVTTAGLLSTIPDAQAALALDRTRVVLNGAEKSISLGVTNQNKTLPYLAQAWVEDVNGKKISDPLVALPPVQRIEPGAKSQVKVQATAGLNLLVQDRESLYYFNLREIPPKSKEQNTLQIALQTRIKVFYRPASLEVDQNSQPWQEQVTLTREGDHYVVHNPTAYFVTIAAAAPSVTAEPVKDFEAVMIAPKGSEPMKASVAGLGSNPVLTYVNDYGGRPKLIFGCSGNSCSVKSTKAG